MTQPTAPDQKPAFSIPSILAAIAAFLSFRFGAIGGVLMAVAAIVLGALGMLLAMAPQRRGGIVSLVSIVLGLIGILAAVFKLLGGNVL